MNSIALMSKTPIKPSKEAMAFAAALHDSGLSSAAVASHMDVTPGLVSQWKLGRRPVAIEHAAKLARLLGVDDPGRICAQYAALEADEHTNVVPLRNPKEVDERRPDLVTARLENDVDSLRYALAAMVSVMASHRPAEGADVAKALRKHVPAKFVGQGYIAELLKALER